MVMETLETGTRIGFDNKTITLNIGTNIQRQCGELECDLGGCAARSSEGWFLSAAINFYQLLSTAIKYSITFGVVSICCHQLLSTSIKYLIAFRVVSICCHQLLSTAIKYLITFRVVSICCHPVSNGMVVGFYQLPSTLFILKSISDEAGVYHLGFSRIQLFLKSCSTFSHIFVSG